MVKLDVPEIIPAVLEKEFDEAETKMDLVKKQTRWLQVDVVDQVFCPGKSFELELLNGYLFENDLPFLVDVHLMVKEPDKWILKAVGAGASRIIGQVEMMEDREKFVRLVHEEMMEAGLGFDVNSEVKDIPEGTEVVLLMGRKAGFEKREMEMTTFKRIENLKKLREEKGMNFKIGVDGGVNKDNIKKLIEAGADILYSTGAIFEGKVLDNLEILNNEIK